MSEPIDPNPWSTPVPPLYPQEPAVPALSEVQPSRRRWVVLGIVAAVVVAGVAIAVVLSSGSSGPHKLGPPLPVPAAIETYSQRTDAIVDQFKSSLSDSAKSAPGELKRFLTNGQLAIYGTGTGIGLPDLVLVMGRSADYPNIADTTTTNQAFGDFGSPQSYDAGHYGGTLQCSNGTEGGASVGACVWSDSTSTGVLLSLTPNITNDDLAELINAARTTIDR